MGINLSRIKKMVREADAREREEREDGARHLAMVSGALLAHSPGLRLVKPCDTDEETYADIQATIAMAEQRTADALRWRLLANDPTDPVHPDYKPWTGGTPEEFRDRFNAEVASIPGKCDRQQRAVAAARKRLGMPADDPDRVCEPDHDPQPPSLESSTYRP